MIRHVIIDYKKRGGAMDDKLRQCQKKRSITIILAWILPAVHMGIMVLLIISYNIVNHAPNEQLLSQLLSLAIMIALVCSLLFPEISNLNKDIDRLQNNCAPTERGD